METNNTAISYPKTGFIKRTSLGVIAKFASVVINALSQIILVPLFLIAWGKDIYGEWLTIFALVTYLSFADFGMQSYVVNRLNKAYALGDLKEYNKILSSAFILYFLIIFILLPLLAILIYFTPLNNLLKIVYTPAKMIKIALFLASMFLLLRLPVKLLSGIYRSIGELPRGVMIANIESFSTCVIIAIALIFKTNFVIIATIQFIPFMFSTLYMLKDLKCRHPEIRFILKNLNMSLALSFIGPGLLFFMIILANALKIQGSILVISVTLGAGLVAVFSIHRTLANLILISINLINHTVWPELTAAEARKDYQTIQTIHNFLIKLSLFLSFSFAIFLFFAGRDIIRIWTRQEILFQPVLWILFLIYLPLVSFWETNGIFQISTNRYKKYSLAKITSAIIGSILAIFMTRFWGIIGTLIGFMAAESIICGWIIPFETLKLIKAKWKDFWINTVGKSFIIIIPQILAGWVLSQCVLNTFVKWVLLIFGIFSTGILFAYLFWLSDIEKEKNNALIKRVFVKMA